ncbi:MAG: TRAP transporter substrate-binding protein [Limnochordia bacterium]|jgi:tripartite ATP-independent transporter DctP family solute receptor
MRTNLRRVCITLFLALSLLAAIAMAAFAAQPIVLRFATDNQPETGLAQGGFKFAELVNERSGGRLQIEVYHSGQLGDDRDVAETIQMGGDMVYAGGSGVVTAWISELKILDLPFLFRDTDHVFAVLNGEIGRRLNPTYEAKGFKLLVYFDGGFRDFSNSKRGIRSVEDIKGLKVRVMQTPYYVDAMREFGAEVIVMPYSELFLALKQGIVDGQENNATLTYTDQMHTLGQKYWSPIHYAYCAVPVMMNINTFKGLPEDLREILVESARDAALWQFEYYKGLEKSYEDKLRAAGVVVPRREELDLTGFRAASERVWEARKSEVDLDVAREIRDYGVEPVKP